MTKSLVCQTASFLATGGFKLIISKCMHGLQSMLLLLHSAFMLSVVKLLLKGEVKVFSLNSHGNYIVAHEWKIMEKSWYCFFEFLWEP